MDGQFVTKQMILEFLERMKKERHYVSVTGSLI